LIKEKYERSNYSEKAILSKEFNLPAICDKNGISLGRCEVKLVKSEVQRISQPKQEGIK